MLTRVKIENFKCIQSLEIPLSPLTAFVGPNDSGKTTILQAVRIGTTGEAEISQRFAIVFSYLDASLGESGSLANYYYVAESAFRRSHTSTAMGKKGQNRRGL